MKITRCPAGHFYDVDQYPDCPHCRRLDRAEALTLPERFTRLGPIRPLRGSTTGRVYKIEATPPLALKAIVCDDDREGVRQALHEAAIMRRLVGLKHVVQLLDTEVERRDGEATVYLLESFHTPLSEMTSARPLDVAGALTLVSSICDALIECREAGVLHLDIQPNNLFIDRDMSVVLGDFGSSLFIDELEDHPGLRGAMGYMAPEVYRGGVCSEQSDLYSLGLYLYSLFNRGCLPFAEAGEEELGLYKRLSGTPFPEVSLEDPALREALMALVRDACAFAPEDRLGSFDRFNRRLHSLVSMAYDSDIAFMPLPRPPRRAVPAGPEAMAGSARSARPAPPAMSAPPTASAPAARPSRPVTSAPPAASAPPRSGSGPEAAPKSSRRGGFLSRLSRLFDSSSSKADSSGADFSMADPFEADAFASTVIPSPSPSLPTGGGAASQEPSVSMPSANAYLSSMSFADASMDFERSAPSPSAERATPREPAPAAERVERRRPAPAAERVERREPSPAIDWGELGESSPAAERVERKVSRDAFESPMEDGSWPLQSQTVVPGRSQTVEPAPAAAPAPRLSQVQFSAVAPKSLRRDEYAMIDIMMYEGAWRHVVDELIQMAEEPVKETKSGLMRVVENASVRIVLSSPDIDIEDNEDVQIWQGGYLHFSFACLLPEDYAKKQVLFTAQVYIDDVIMTRLKFIARCDEAPDQKLSVSRADVLSAFISYASQDRSRVATIVQGMKKARPDLDLFFDVESLRSGEDWEQTLYREIDARDVLYLCWSHYAKASKWVDFEWRYALRSKGIDCIEPVPIESPDQCPPPSELERKHFNDRMLYIIHAQPGGSHGF